MTTLVRMMMRRLLLLFQQFFSFAISTFIKSGYKIKSNGRRLFTRTTSLQYIDALSSSTTRKMFLDRIYSENINSAFK